MPLGGGLSLGISAGSSILGGLLGGKGAKKAAQQQAEAQQRVATLATQRADSGQAGIAEGENEVGQATHGGQDTLAEAIRQQLGLYSPYIQAGTQSLSSIQDLANSSPLTQRFSFNPSDLQNDPGYAFTLKQGQDAIQRSAAAQGGLLSGGTLKSLAGYTTGTANQYFNDAYNRSLGTFQANQQQALNRIGTLQNLATMGYSGTTGAANAIGTGATNIADLGLRGAGLNLGGAEASAGIGMDAARIAGNAISGQGQSQAAGTVGSTNSWLSAANNLNSSILGYFGKKFPGGGTNSSGINSPAFRMPLPVPALTNPLGGG